MRKTALLLSVLALVLGASTTQATSPSSASGLPAAAPDDLQPFPPDAPEIAGVATSSGLPDTIMISLKAGDEWLPPQYTLDAGATWHEVVTVPWTESPGSVLIAIAPQENHSVRLLAAVERPNEPVRIYRTEDLGATWAEHEAGDDFAVCLVASPAEPRRLYLSTSWSSESWPWPPVSGAHAYTSADAGVTWSWVMSASEAAFIQIVPSPSVDARVYMRQSGFPSGWLQSDDAGESWSWVVLPVGELALDSLEPLWLYGLADWWGDISGYSRDGGVTWIPWTGHPSDSGQLLAHPTTSDSLFELTDQGLHRSSDGGITWEHISPWRSGFLSPDYGVAGRLLWAQGDCLLASANDGADWIRLGPGCARVFLPLVMK